MQPVLLITDVFVFLVLFGAIFYAWHIRHDRHLLTNWKLALKRPVAMVSSMVLMFFVVMAALDSIHYRPALAVVEGKPISYSSEAVSVLDVILMPLTKARERSYSAPLTATGFRKETVEINGQKIRDYPRLKFGGAQLKDPSKELLNDVAAQSFKSILFALTLLTAWTVAALQIAAKRSEQSFSRVWYLFRHGHTFWPWRSVFLTLGFMLIVITWVVTLSDNYHVFGTDRTGNSVLVFALKSVRTALVIGSLTTLVVLPLALLLGVMAGYFRGWVDEVIQYIYTLLASIPDVLLIAASVLLLQVFIDKNQGFFETALERSDARLFFLCLILGVTSFTGLCRLVRGETLKLRELEYIQSARAFGVSAPRILRRHIVPNLMHLVLINTVMQFSSFVLAEAVLSYVGVGVDPKTASFGVMINTARAELAATPIVWWTLSTAFVFMFLIVLSANLLSDAVRDAFDPRARLRGGATATSVSDQPPFAAKAS